MDGVFEENEQFPTFVSFKKNTFVRNKNYKKLILNVSKRRKVYFSKTADFTGRPKMKNGENPEKVGTSPYTSRYEIVVKMKKDRLDELYTIKKIFF